MPNKAYAHDGYKSRKFWYAVGLTAAACLLVLLGKVSDLAWKDVVETVVAAYLASNVGERWTASKEHKDKDEDPK